jgi:hypothetical protein
MKTTETKVVSIRPSATIGKFLVILKPNPFPLHPKFSHFQFNPDFEHITTEAQVDHLAVYTTKKPRLRVGETIINSVRTPIETQRNEVAARGHPQIHCRPEKRTEAKLISKSKYRDFRLC